MRIKNNQNGVAHIAAILVVIVIAVVGFVGWKVWDNKQDKDQTQANTKSSTQKVNEAKDSKEVTNAETKDKVGLTQSDRDGIEKAMLASESCSLKEYKYIDKEGLSDTEQTQLVDNYVRTNNGCLMAQDEQYSGAAYFLKKEGRNWSVVLATQMANECNIVDGRGIPAALGTCVDSEGTERAIRP